MFASRITKVFILILLGLQYAVALAEEAEYTIGPEDELTISFWQEPQLNTNVRVGQDGRIVLPVVGSITADGLTPSQLGRKIVDKISIYNKSITQCSVVILHYGSNKLYITGQVRQPGKKTFEVIPNLWDAILEAGGPTEDAGLSNVTIIRGGFEKGKRIVIDLAQVLNDGDLSKLPTLYKGDTIFVPANPSSNPTARMASPLAQQSTIYVYGAVVRPGNYTISSNMSLIEALALAGGFTEQADISQIRVISNTGVTPVVTLVNLKDDQKLVQTKPIQLSPNDTIIVTSGGNSFFRGTWGQFLTSFLTTVISVAVSAFIYQMFQQQR